MVGAGSPRRRRISVFITITLRNYKPTLFIANFPRQPNKAHPQSSIGKIGTDICLCRPQGPVSIEMESPRMPKPQMLSTF